MYAYILLRTYIRGGVYTTHMHVQHVHVCACTCTHVTHVHALNYVSLAGLLNTLGGAYCLKAKSAIQAKIDRWIDR